MPTSRRKKISRFGAVAILLGAAEWAATGSVSFSTAPIIFGVIGLVLATLAMLGALLIGNTGKFIPFAGWVVCCVALAYGVTHQPAGTHAFDQIKEVIAVYRPAAPAAAQATPAQRARPAVADDSARKGTIFDMTDAGTALPTNAPTAVSPPPRSAPTPAVMPHPPAAPSTSAMQRYTAAMNAVTRAHVQADKANAAVVSGLSQTPAYQAAKTELDNADTSLHAALANNGIAGNSGLVAAEQRYLDAKAEVQKLVNAAADADPASAAAKQVLVDAQGELRIAKDDLAIAGTSGRLK